ncbi:hypothetical protein GKC29_18530 [Micromonospora sp. WMMC415]|uniref:hypothetical protein n=1 Tax=Micromonospora sp. WMMC415 TaxID=2675222 RepID=UPI0012B45B28|nr:hypothetical protein [Micromonospora sp. WMMC415]QGN48627.1 hypothetical protein GKC29_18530 [Micromonospora sp. WMMC415]
MTILPTRAALTAAASAILPVLLLSGCAGGEQPAAGPSPSPMRTVPADLCDRIDYTLANPAFRKVMPIPPVDDDRGPGFRCSQGFFGGDGYAGGFVLVRVQTFDSPGAARTGFDRAARTSTAQPFQGGSEIAADAVRYQEVSGDTRLEVLDSNVIMEVRLAAPNPVSDEQAPKLGPASVQIALQALELVRAS